MWLNTLRATWRIRWLGWARRARRISTSTSTHGGSWGSASRERVESRQGTAAPLWVSTVPRSRSFLSFLPSHSGTMTYLLVALERVRRVFSPRPFLMQVWTSPKRSQLSVGDYG